MSDKDRDIARGIPGENGEIGGGGTFKSANDKTDEKKEGGEEKKEGEASKESEA